MRKAVFRIISFLLIYNFCFQLCGEVKKESRVYLDELELKIVKQGWGKSPQSRKSCLGKQLKVNGKVYERGVGTHADVSFYVALDGMVKKFDAHVGVDDETGGKGSIIIKIFGDGKVLYKSDVIRGGEEPRRVSVNVWGIKNLIVSVLSAYDGIDSDHADLLDAYFVVEGAIPRLVPAPEEGKYILTPPLSPVPKINPPRITGVRPGSPFIFRIPCTGVRPIKFAIEGLPEGLSVNVDGIITGRIVSREQRAYDVLIKAENEFGKDENTLRIVVGEILALTPPMGWNHWYAFYDRVTADIVKQAVDAMVSSGMADVGYQYVCIDDCWANAKHHGDPMRVGPPRDENGDILPNKHFPNMKELTDYIHSKGLRAGIYTSPGPTTCAGFTGSYKYECQDAKKFAEWGFDLLKYDWCSYSQIKKPDRLENLKEPYKLMGDVLKSLDRDIVFNLCQYGMGEVWKWGKEVGGHSWRTAGDLGLELHRYHEVALRNSTYWEYAGRGAWNDPDYLLLGYVGDASEMGEPKPCPLTPSEQYSYMSLWCLMSAPLFLSSDMSRLDEFTLNILCNSEVIEVNQDPAGIQGRPIVINREAGYEVWMKPLSDGDIAIGIFNRDEITQSITVRWSELGLSGPFGVRDIWRQKEIGVFNESFTSEVARHGVSLIRVKATKRR